MLSAVPGMETALGIYWLNAVMTQTKYRVQSLGRDDPLEKGLHNYCSILAWRIPWTEKPGELHFGVAKNKTQLSNEYFYFLSSTFEILILQSEGKMRN